MKILAIDDMADNLTVLKAVLEDRLPEATLLTALSGPKGLKLAAAEDPDVILLDIVMPGMDGYEVCRKLKADVILKAIPVLFLTAHTDRDSRVKAVEAGADGFLSKPFDELELTVQLLAMTKLKAANCGQRLEKEQLSALVAERTRALEQELAERKRAQREIQTILRTTIDGYYLVDTNGRFLDTNDAYCQMSGFTRDELLRMGVEDVDAIDTASDIKKRIRQIRKAGHVRFETKHQRKDGSTYDLEASCSFIREEDRERIVVFMRDITGRKRAEAYREMGRQVLQILNEPGDFQACLHRVLSVLKARTGVDALGIRLKDGEDFPYIVHDGFSKDFLRAENSLIGRDAEGCVCRDSDGNACLECTCGLVVSGKTPSAHPLFTPGGSFWTNDSSALLDLPPDKDPRFHPRNLCIRRGYASVALVPIRTQDEIVGLIQFNDRRKKRFTLETVELVEAVASHIGEALIRKRTEQKLSEALDRAESASRAKSDFLAVMSHELRTPLNGVLGFAELLADSPLDDEQREYARTISNSGEHLLGIVNDILDFSSIEKGGISLESAPVVISSLLESSCLPVKKDAAKKGIEFRCEVAAGVPEQIAGDTRRIRQILINLLGNAVKFTARGSVVFRVEPASADGRKFLDFSVQDSGPGIPAEMLGSLFKPFTQGDSTLSRPFQGAGLGLAISRRLAEAMGGAITVRSIPGDGSSFTFRLPVKNKSDALSEPAGKPGDPVSAKPRRPGDLVLVVEDDPGNSLLAVKMLEAIGYRAETASNGQEALDAFARGKFRAILMDMQMPVMNGLTATGKIREIEALSGGHVPIIALTANVMPGDSDRCLAAGMDDFLSKPFDKAGLAAKLASAARER